MKKRIIGILLVVLSVFSTIYLGGCGNTADKGNHSDNVEGSGSLTEQKILIAFFSRADENYGVGTVEKGNTQIIAEMIAEETGGELFLIQRSTPYPAAYNDCTAEAQREKNSQARPDLLQTKDISEYDVIFIGYPIWWSDMPMPVYTFIESQNWNGKTVIPFCTHAGSGLSGTVGTLRSKCTGATVSDGFSIAGTTAQNNRTQALSQVKDWLAKLDFNL